MNRRFFCNALGFFGVGATLPLTACSAGASKKTFPLQLSEAQWRKLLPYDRFQVLRNDATEPSGSSALNKEENAGTYTCAGCNLPLFSSVNKYDSGTGWPSFWQPLHADNIGTTKDFKLIKDKAIMYGINQDFKAIFTGLLLIRKLWQKWINNQMICKNLM